jgi:hypothetical protein
MFNEGSVQHFPLSDTTEDTENDESDGEGKNAPEEDTENDESDREKTHEIGREEDQSGSGSSDSEESV